MFRQFTQFYEQRLKGDVPDPYEHRDDWAKLLQCLAFAMMQGPDPQQKPTELSVAIPQDQAERVLTDFLREREPYPAKVAERCLRDLLKHHLIQTNGEQIEFRHQMIQEYYAAEYLLRLLPELSDDQLKQAYLNYLKWTESIALMLALETREEQALHVVKLAIDVDFILGAKLAGAVQLDLQLKSIAILNSLKLLRERKLFLMKRNYSVELPKWLRIQLLEETKSAESFSVLRKFLQDSEPLIRISAARALGRLGDKGAEPQLIELQRDPNHNVRQVAESELWRIESEVVLPQKAFEDMSKLLTLKSKANKNFLKNPDDQIQNGKNQWILDLKGALQSSEAITRRYAVYEIDRQRFSEVVPELLEMTDDPDIEVRRQIAIAIGNLCDSSFAPKLLEMLDDSDINVLVNACEALGKLGNKIATPNLIKILEENPDFWVRRHIVKVLGNLADQRAVPHLITCLHKDESPRVRWQAAIALANLEIYEAVPTLKEGLNNLDSDMRVDAIKALSNFQSLEVQRLALHTLKDLDLDLVVRSFSEDLLIKIGDKRIVPSIIDLILNSNPDVSWSAVKVLRKLDVSLTTKFLPRLRQLLHLNIGEQAFNLSRSIQSSCKFYNYEIWQAAIQKQAQVNLEKQIAKPLPDGLLAKIDQTTQAIHRRTEKMANEPKNDFSNATFNAPVNFGDQPRGDFIGTQNNDSPAPEVQRAIAELQTLLNQLTTQHPTITDEVEALAIIDAEFTEIKQSPSHRFATLRQKLLNPERHAQAIKATLEEMVKHYLEETILGKSIITYLAKMSEKPNHGA
ncbi:MAG: HEAT repeat domain-containing protein [Cyanobacteria bacterium P01_D01_bin.56]